MDGVTVVPVMAAVVVAAVMAVMAAMMSRAVVMAVMVVFAVPAGAGQCQHHRHGDRLDPIENHRSGNRNVGGLGLTSPALNQTFGQANGLVIDSRRR
jgi:hypothetical protein